MDDYFTYGTYIDKKNAPIDHSKSSVSPTNETRHHFFFNILVFLCFLWDIELIEQSPGQLYIVCAYLLK